MPLVESKYRIKADAQNRAIVGLSMGGGQSLTVGMNNPDKFAWVGGFSAAVPKETDVATLADVPALNKKLKWLWIGIGKDDFLLERNKEFLALLDSKGVRHQFKLSEGGHSFPVWRSYLEEIVPQLFAARQVTASK